MANDIVELSIDEIDEVAGGPLPIALIAFGKGVLVGGGVATIGIAVADALDWVDAF